MIADAFAASGFDFELTDAQVAHEPPEARGLARDDLRLLVSHVRDDHIEHARFRELPAFLAPGDVLVVNASATINAALAGWRERTWEPVVIHLCAPLADKRWILELRRITGAANAPLLTAMRGERVQVAAIAPEQASLNAWHEGEARRGGSLRWHEGDAQRGGSLRLIEPFRPIAPGRARLWIAHIDLPGGVLPFSARFGSPIRYDYVRERWPLEYYQTIFASEPGSAEMPSAGRAFAPGLVARLKQQGVRIAPLILHTGVASQDAGETPYPERYRVPHETAALINDARAAGHRIVAVGTTVVRALETVASANGRVRAAAGWTDLHLTAERGVHSVDALLTGLHAPGASHLQLLEAFAGTEHIALTYDSALRAGYLWHEFGDLHLLDRGNS